MPKNERNLSTTTEQVFGNVKKGTECRICGRDVTDGRSKYCSDYCSNLATAVMWMLNWSSVRRNILERDDETCQECGFRYAWIQKGNEHIRDIIESSLPERPETPSIEEMGSDDADGFDWDSYYDRVDKWRERREELKDRYGDPYSIEMDLEVDHITPLSEGGHPFDPANLQVLCSECHKAKTARGASRRANRRTPSASEINESLFEYVDGGGES